MYWGNNDGTTYSTEECIVSKCCFILIFMLLQLRLVSLSLDCAGELGQRRLVGRRVELAREEHEGLVQGAPVQGRHLTQPDLEHKTLV